MAAPPPVRARWPRPATLVGVTVALLVIGWMVRSTDSTAVVVVEAPPQDHVVPRLLTDGTPVWISTSPLGDVQILEAFAPGGGPIGGLVGWCESGLRFVDPQLGLTFGPDGRRYGGFVPGRLNPRTNVPVGLTPRRTQVEGRFRAGAPIRVLQAEDPWLGTQDPPLMGELAHGPPEACRLADRQGDLPETPALPPGLTDHAFLATDIDATTDGWQVARGWLQIHPDAGISWCPGPLRDRSATACDGDGDGIGVPVDLDLAVDELGAVVTNIGDPLAVRLSDGQIVQAAVLPSSTWAGSSLQGSRTVRLQLLGPDPTGNRVLVTAATGVPCVSPAPQMTGAPEGTRVVYIDTDTRMDVRGTSEVEDLAELNPPADGFAVDVVLDAITCRALAIRDPG
ncbi:MAG: hypothetical protein ACR2HR_00750 [Euzebya sp.]